MTKEPACSPAPGPLEDFTRRFYDVFSNMAQRRSFRSNLQGILLLRDQHRASTGRAGTQPVTGAHDPSVRQLQFFLSEAAKEVEALNTRRLE
jgi:hypothetical protein